MPPFHSALPAGVLIGASLHKLTMNYIHQLQAEVRSLKDQVVALEDGIHHLRDYASSDKFMGPSGYGGPTYINKLDVINRCNDALENRFHAEAPAWFRAGASTGRLPDRC